MNLKNKETYIFVKNWIVDKITQVSKADLPKSMEESQVFIWYSDDPCPLKEKDVLTIKDLDRLALIHRPTLVPAEELPFIAFKEEFKQREIRREELITSFSKVYKNINTNSSSELLKTLREDKEVYYRVFYNSLKMYRMRSYILSLTNELIKLSGHTPSESIPDLLTQFKTLNFDNVLVRSLEKSIGRGFFTGCNNPKVWAEEALVLTGTFNLFLEATEFLRAFILRLQKSESFIHHQSFLEWDEAGAMETWTPLGALRSSDKYHSMFK